MRKAWLYQRKNRKGCYVGWYDSSSKRRSKMLPNKSLAQQFARQVEFRNNADIYPDPTRAQWDSLVAEYTEYKQTVRSLAAESLRSIKVTLEQFKELHGPVLSTKIDERLINKFIAHRLQSASKPTVNKDIRNLRAFVRWAIKSRYVGQQAASIEWLMQKEAKRPVKALTKKQLTNLLIAAKKYTEAWYIRVLLAATTGLRKGDIEKLLISDIDFDSGTINTFSQKTGKGMANRPLHPKVVTELSKHFDSLREGQVGLFVDKFTSGKWGRIRKSARLPNLKFRDLRVTFASFVAQAGFSTSVTQHLLEHSTARLTHQVYTDVEPMYRKAVESVPVDDVITG